MAGHVFRGWINPFAGVVSAGTTSVVVDLRDAIAWSYSYYTISGTTSAHTIQLSNSSVNVPSSVPAASFVDYGTFGTGTKGAIVFGEPGVRYARFLRDASNGSFVIDLVKLQA